MIVNHTTNGTSIVKGYCLRLHNDDGQKTMNGYFGQTLNGNVVEASMFFQPTKDTLDPYPSVVDSLEFGSFQGQSFLMSGVSLDDRLCPVLSDDMPAQRVAGVASVRRNPAGVELRVGNPSLSEKRFGCTAIMDVSSSDRHGYRKLIFNVTEQVYLISQPELFEFSRGAFDRPRGVLIGGRLLGLIRPCLNVCGVYGDVLSEAWQSPVELSGHTPTDILDHDGIARPSKLGKEAGKGGLARDFVGGLYPASHRYERVILEEANHTGHGRQTHSVADKEASPENLNGVTWSAESPVSVESLEEFFVREGLEKCP